MVRHNLNLSSQKGFMAQGPRKGHEGAPGGWPGPECIHLQEARPSLQGPHGRLLSPYEFGLLNLALPGLYMAVLLSSGHSPGQAVVSEAEVRTAAGPGGQSPPPWSTRPPGCPGCGSLSLGPISSTPPRPKPGPPPPRGPLLPFGVLVAAHTGTFRLKDRGGWAGPSS